MHTHATTWPRTNPHAETNTLSGNDTCQVGGPRTPSPSLPFYFSALLTVPSFILLAMTVTGYVDTMTGYWPAVCDLGNGCSTPLFYFLC